MYMYVYIYVHARADAYAPEEKDRQSADACMFLSLSLSLSLSRSLSLFFFCFLSCARVCAVYSVRLSVCSYCNYYACMCVCARACALCAHLRPYRFSRSSVHVQNLAVSCVFSFCECIVSNVMYLSNMSMLCMCIGTRHVGSHLLAYLPTV